VELVNMTRKLLGLALALVMIIASSEAQAGKGSSGGGRPSFSGGSRPSFGGGSRPSFGGGSSIKPSTPAVSKPTFGGGSSVKPTPTTGSTPKFGGGSNTVKGGPTDKPTFGGGSTSPPGKTVSTTPIAGKTPSSVSKRPVAESFDKLSGTEARKVESRRSYEKSEAPAPSYKTPAGKEVKLDPKDKTTDYLRGRLDESRWQTRYQRTDVFYGSYYSRPVIVYNDYYHPHWNYWLLAQPMDVLSLWVYHHQLDMMRQDQARLNALYAGNAELKARVAALERQGIPRDPTYTPKGVDADVMYNDAYVDAVVNPRPKVVDHYEYDNPPMSATTGWVLLWIFVIIPVGCLAVFCLYYIVFRYRY